eukprot:1159323-Pelagomonas_calceolata.AAC.5
MCSKFNRSACIAYSRSAYITWSKATCIHYLEQISIHYLEQSGIQYLEQGSMHYLEQSGVHYPEQSGMHYLEQSGILCLQNSSICTVLNQAGRLHLTTGALSYSTAGIARCPIQQHADVPAAGATKNERKNWRSLRLRVNQLFFISMGRSRLRCVSLVHPS